MEEPKPEPEVRTMEAKADFHVYCFVCSKHGPYFKLDGGGLKKISATMKKTERGYAHVDCLA